MKLTGGQALAAQLVREGVRHVFGVPGVQLDHAMDGLHGVADDITFVGTRHEQASAYMADGYARTSAEIGVCSVVPGPGLLNAAAALSTAYACNSRVLCISGQIPSRTIGKGLGMLHEIPNQSTVLDSVTKWHALATEVEQIPALVREAFARLQVRPSPPGRAGDPAGCARRRRPRRPDRATDERGQPHRAGQRRPGPGGRDPPRRPTSGDLRRRRSAVSQRRCRTPGPGGTARRPGGDESQRLGQPVRPAPAGAELPGRPEGPARQ